jgi:imidazolonepropionase-like amidohydrolase
MKDCRARKVKRRAKSQAKLLLWNDEKMDMHRCRARMCRNQAAPRLQSGRFRMLLGAFWASLAMAHAGVAATPQPAVEHGAQRPGSGTLAMRCGKLIDGVSRTAAGPAVVTIRGGRIVSVERGGKAPRGVPVLDLDGHTCLPGLIDLHTHLADSPGSTADLTVYYRRTLAEQVALARENAAVTLQAGFTSVRDVGTYIGWADKALREEIDAGKVPGPRMQVAGYYLTIPAGGGDLVIPGHAEAEIPAQVRLGVARGPAEFARKAQAAVDGGADVLKVIASGAVLAYGGVPGEPEMTPEELAAVTRVAHEAGRKVAAHAHGARSIKEAILAGADTIEHASLIDDEGIRLAREHGVALSMDVYNGDYIDTEGRKQGWPEEFLRKNIETTEAQRQGFTRAHAAGVDIVFGSDAAVFPHGLNARQFPVMVQRGMTPMQAIQAATSVAARHMGWDDRVGSVQPGRFGDVIAVKGDPLADIALLQDVAVVVKGGLVFRQPSP